MSKYDEAEPLYWRALEIREARLGSVHPEVASTLNALALLLDAQGRGDAALPLYKRALAIYETSLGKAHPDVALTLHNLAILLAERPEKEDQTEAESLFKRAAAIREKALGPTHPLLAATNEAYAKLLFRQGRLKESETVYRGCILVLEVRASAPNPDSAWRSSRPLSDGLFSPSRSCSHAPCLSLPPQVGLGAGHADVGRTQGELAKVLQAQHRYEDAVILLRLFLGGLEKRHGPDHAEVASALLTLALMLEESTSEEARAEMAQDVASGVARSGRGVLEDPEPIFRRCLAIRTKALGAEHPSTIPPLDGLVRITSARGKFEDSEGLCKRALVLRERIFGIQVREGARTGRGAIVFAGPWAESGTFIRGCCCFIPARTHSAPVSNSPPKAPRGGHEPGRPRRPPHRAG